MKRQRLAIGLIVLGAFLVVLGLAQGEAGQVMLKGIRICLECIGIG